MEKILVEGGRRLSGEVYITGAKNAALGIFPATILCGGKCVLENLPDIQDIRNYKSLLLKLGAKIYPVSDNALVVDTSEILIDNTPLIEEETTNMRASYYMLGALLAKFHKVRLALPGGCNIGTRPIDQHVKGFKALGATVTMMNGYIEMVADELVGNNIYFDVVSVGATINVMLAATMANGVTTIGNAAKEPHVVDIANFLNLAGANIVGAGTDTLKITGAAQLNPVTYGPIPDQISAGTYMIASAATAGDVLVRNVIPEHLEAITSKLIEMGNEVIVYDDSVRVIGAKTQKAIKLKTLPHPGFPTDLQQPMGVLMSIAKGVSSIQENIFENRFAYLDELIKMGADVMVNGNVAVITGVEKLYSARIQATDLRAGAAMIIAALIAEGITEITELHHIDRGYDNIVGRMQKLGSNITRVQEP
jgi:UDP-N-acetylglucosamine 1-carboxyvinyltransferase